MNQYRFFVLALLAALLLTSCLQNNPAVVQPQETVLFPTVDALEAPAYQWLPTDSNGVLEQTSTILETRNIKNRYDVFPQNTIAVCNSSYQIPQAYQEQIREIMDFYDFDVTFYMIDIESGTSFAYNPDVLQATASTVKIGFCFACLTQIQNGEYSLEDEVEYRPIHKLSGSGSTKYSQFGTKLTVKNLLYRTIYESDNSAYLMLMTHFGTERYNQLMEEIGVSHRLDWDENRWGYFSAHDLGLIWQAIYDYRDSCDEGRLLWEYATTNLYNELKETMPEYETIAHKSGWNDDGYHESGIVCGNDGTGDYIVVIMTKTGLKTLCVQKMARVLDSVISDYRTWEKNQA